MANAPFRKTQNNIMECNFCINGCTFVTENGPCVCSCHATIVAPQTEVIPLVYGDVLDSGKREEFDTGSVRDTQDGKGRFDLVPEYPLRRLAQHYENGAVKYGDNNWQKGQPLSRYTSSMRRHAFRSDWTDEDHLAAVAWNAFAIMWTLNEIEEGRLPKELDDR